MLIVDKLLVGSIKFVLGKVAAAVEQELNDDEALKEQLLRAQMMLELGQMSQAEFDELEATVLERLREIKARREGQDGMAGGIQLHEIATGDVKVTGIEADFTADSFHEPPSLEASPAPEVSVTRKPPRRRPRKK